VGRILGEEITELFLKDKPFVLGLEGELGGGKTTFLKGLAKGFGIKEKILSPTFLIFKKFKIPLQKRNSKTKRNIRPRFFYHLDCYRIEKEKDLLDLGFQKIIADPDNVIAVEWADKIKKIMPLNTIWIKFRFMNKNKREIVIRL
jgi:tRNA threonylcarbamoyladenosine biosynthesis protein TsaE